LPATTFRRFAIVDDEISLGTGSDTFGSTRRANGTGCGLMNAMSTVWLLLRRTSPSRHYAFRRTTPADLAMVEQ